MTQEEKELVLKGLCARLQYKLHCRVFKLNGDIKENDDILYGVIGDNIVTLKSDEDECLMYYQIKPYLRPMSSMTLEEECEFCRLFECDSVNAMYGYINWVVGGSCDYDDFDIEFSKLAKIIDWLNKHHFDYRGLIEMGLALVAPEGMYEIK